MIAPFLPSLPSPLRAAVAAGLSALLAGCIFDQANRGTIVDNEVRTGILYLADGNPAPNARVRVYPVNHQPDTSAAAGQAAYVTATDAQGRYSVKVAKGEFNILGDKDGSYAFQDSVFFGGGNGTLAPDTLSRPGSVAGVIALQPNHNPISCLVQFLGTHAFANVDANGRFRVPDLAAGDYTVRVATTIPEYTPLFLHVRVRSGRDDTLPDTLRLPYIGIPVVTGLKAVYDTADAVVNLSWDPVAYRDFSEYLIYRDPQGVLAPAVRPIGSSTAPVFADTLLGDAAGFLDPADRNTLPFEYRVRVRNKSDQVGLSYGRIPVQAVGPGHARPWDSLELRAFRWDSAKKADRVVVLARLRSPKGGLKSIRWSIVPGDSLIATRALGGAMQAEDSVAFDWRAEGSFGVLIRVEDLAGKGITDTLHVPGNSAPIKRTMVMPEYGFQADGADSVDCSVQDPDGDSIRYSLRNNPSWLSIGPDGFLRSAGSNAEAGRYAGIVVSASDGRRTVESDPFAVVLNSTPWETFGTVPDGSGSGRAVAIGSRIYLLGASTKSPQTVLVFTPASRSWAEAPPLPEELRDYDVQAVGSSLFVIGGFRNTGDSTTSLLNLAPWAYDTLTRAWTRKNPMPTGRRNPTLALLDGKILVIGGTEYHGSGIAAVEVFDPAANTWTRKKDMPLESGYPRIGSNASAIGWNGLVYAFGFVGAPVGGANSRLVVYDPVAETWTNRASMRGQWAHRAAGVINGKFYAAGGTAFAEYTAEVEAFDPATNTWAQKTPMPKALAGSTSAVVGNHLYLFHGYEMGTFTNVVQRYDPGLDP